MFHYFSNNWEWPLHDNAMGSRFSLDVEHKMNSPLERLIFQDFMSKPSFGHMLSLCVGVAQTVRQ